MSTIQFEPVVFAPEVVEDQVSQTSGGDLLVQTLSLPPSDPTSRQWMRLVEISGTLSFWDKPEEDIYTVNDGEPV